MLEIENNLDVINAKLSEILEGASLIKFSYSGIYTLEFDLPKEQYGSNCFYIDIGTQMSISAIEDRKLFDKKFSIEDLFLVWSKNVSQAKIENDLSLTLYFEDLYECRIASKLFDPEKIFDMRWTLYQPNEQGSFSIWVSDEENIYCQIPNQ
jgi:hypothetical protein